jgi:Flp pilus assembly protein TadD
MPSTVNGCGTHYYGKKNLQKRPGPCPHCGRAGELSSYDTRVYVVFLFIPIFPLKRMRIIDYCSSCTRHYAMEADKWETAKQLEVSGALEKFRANPTPEAAIEAHQQMMNFHQLAEATEFRRTMREKYPDNAKVHAYLGAALEHFGQLEEANAAYARALALRADLPEARVGVACGHIRAGNLDAARTLLDFLEKPGAAQLYSLEPLDTLARAFQGATRHEDALALFAQIQRELPKLGEEKWFRALVAKSEKAAGRRESQLPKLKFSLKRLFAPGQASTARTLILLGVIAALVLLGFVIANEYIRRHRTLHIVNGYPQPASVEIAGVGQFDRLRGVQEVALPEGRYHAVIRQPVAQELDFEVRSDYWSRWFSDPAWVLNLGGEAILIRSQVTYSRNPGPPVVTFHFGTPFEKFTRVTHPFTELPESLRLKSSETRILVDLQWHQGTAADILGFLSKNQRADDALNFAERWLRLHAEDEHLLRLYLSVAARHHQTNRSDVFLRAGLAARPVRIEWHRAYQAGRQNPAQSAALVSEYDELLRAEPTNSALLYLRGRIDGNRARACDYFQRATQADAANPYPAFALGYDRMVAGDWAGARPLFARAVELRPDDASFEHWLTLARFALGEAAQIEGETRKQLTQDPAEVTLAVRLVDALVALGRRDQVMDACNAFERACGVKYGADGNSVANAVRCHALYALGDFAGLEKAAAAEKVLVAGTVLIQAMIEQGRLADVVKALLPEEDDEDYRPVLALGLSVAFRQAGDTAAADRWLEQARKRLAAGNEDSAAAATFLGRAAAPPLAEAQSIVLPPQQKAVYLAALIVKHPEARADLAPLARRLNVELSFPHHLVQRATTTSP